MPEVVAIHSAARFDAAKWVAEWEAIGGRCFLGPDAPSGLLPRILLLGPMVPAHSPCWLRLRALQSQAEDQRKVGAVADFIEWRKATRGW